MCCRLLQASAGLVDPEREAALHRDGRADAGVSSGSSGDQQRGPLQVSRQEGREETGRLRS